MSKKISKLLLTFLLITLIVSSFTMCFADNDEETAGAVTTSEDGASTTTNDSSETKEESIHNGDLYLFDDKDIVMDKLVDGNVFILGKNVEITGQINGNLFVCANNIKFNESYVRYSIFACANSVYYNGACNDLYVATSNLETTYESYVIRDLKTINSNTVLKSAIGRDVDLRCNTVDFGSEDKIPVIYGNLRYSANNQMEIPEGVIGGEGKVIYTKPTEVSNKVNVFDILIGFGICIATALIVFTVIEKATPNFAEKISNKKLSVIEILKALLVGLVSILVVIIAFVLLLISSVGIELGFILLLLFVVLCLVAVPVLAIKITVALKPALKIEKTYIFYLVLALVSIILHGIKLIPVVGGLLGFLIKTIAIGLIISLFITHKELTDEERAAIEEAKNIAKENKERIKQEKLEAKKAKKENKE